MYLSTILLAASKRTSSECPLPGFSYAPDVDDEEWTERTSSLPSGGLYGADCSEHRWKLYPSCTWHEEQVVKLRCPCGSMMRGLSVRYARVSACDERPLPRVSRPRALQTA